MKPATVQRAMEELGWSDPIMGKGNREANAVPVRELREHLMDWKLLRKYKGRLLLTPLGKRGLERPAELWRHLVESVGRPEHDAVRLVTGLYDVEWHLKRHRTPVGRAAGSDYAGAAGGRFCHPVGRPIPRDWAVEINYTVRWTFKCLDLPAPEDGSVRAEQYLPTAA